MPQLDKVTFLSQFFWSSFIFLSFYFLLTKYILPSMSRILKLRKKKMRIGLSGEGIDMKEKQKIRTGAIGLLSAGFHTVGLYFNRNFSKNTDWLNREKQSTAKKQYGSANSLYVTGIVESSLSQSLTSFERMETPFFIPGEFGPLLKLKRKKIKK